MFLFDKTCSMNTKFILDESVIHNADQNSAQIAQSPKLLSLHNVLMHSLNYCLVSLIA